MPISCKICNQTFNSLITSTHLKKHNLSTKDYISEFGKDSLTSSEYRLSRASAYVGKNNPNFGNKMSEESKKSISDSKKGKKPWNYGIKFENTTLQKESAIRREQRYNNGEIVRHSTIMTDEIKEKISNSVKEYAQKNTADIKKRAVVATQTKIQNGYYTNKKIETKKKFVEKCIDYGFVVESMDDTIASIKCKICNTISSRSVASALHNNMCPMCSKIGTSSYELELVSELRKIIDCEIKTSDKSILGNLELDVYIPDYNFAIEIDGLFWHSEKNGKSKHYHKYKTDKCKEKGIQLIHIFEDEWLTKKALCLERIKSKLNLSSYKTYARNFKVKVITNSEASVFLSEHHLQGRGVASDYCYSLVDNVGKIHAVMTFSKLSISKGSTHRVGHYELNRYASIGNVVGGASKLFSYFIKNVEVKEIISYSDIRWNTGQLYKKLGFMYLGDTLPGYWYVKGVERIHRFKLRKTESDPKHITEKELRESQGFSRIWDCGHSKWVWKPQKVLYEKKYIFDK